MGLFGCFLCLLLLVASVASVAFWVWYLLFFFFFFFFFLFLLLLPEKLKTIDIPINMETLERFAGACKEHIEHRKMVLTNIAKENVEV